MLVLYLGEIGARKLLVESNASKLGLQYSIFSQACLLFYKVFFLPS